ncbi:MAG: hypothetical protein ACRDGE_01385 [Candidatus Limnocylindria bacterium]
MFAFINSFDETEASVFLVRPANMTLPIQMFLYVEQYQNPRWRRFRRCSSRSRPSS